MKRYAIRGAICILGLLLLCLPMVSANSGPTYWQGYPSSEVLLIDQGCPIEVEQEHLLFDLREGSRGHHTVQGQVTASYQMINPTDHSVSVQMAFPFISSLNNFSPEHLEVAVDGIAVPYELFIGGAVHSFRAADPLESQESLVFEDLLNEMTRQTYQAVHFTEDERGVLYTIEIQPTKDERINLAVDIVMDAEKSRVLSKGFNGYTQKDDKIQLTAWCYRPEVLEILVLGEAFEPDISVFLDGELRKETSDYISHISTRERELKAYLMDYVREYEKRMSEELEPASYKMDAFDETQLYNLYAATLDELFTTFRGCVPCEQVTEQNYYERVLTVLYNVDFPAQSSQNVTVRYRASGTMDKTQTTKPVYTFEYLLHPAASWRAFKNLTIEIMTPEEAPYIVESSIPLANKGGGTYLATLPALPETDLGFTIHGEENITIVDRAYAKLYRHYIYYIPLILIALIPLAVGLLCWYIIRLRSGKRKGLHE